MTERIIISTISLLMLALTIKKGDKQSIFLNLGLTLGILITWINIPIIITFGMVIYMLTALVIAFASLRNKDLSKLKQVTIILSGIWAFTTNLFSIMHWPFADEIRLSMIIPIVFYTISLLNGISKRKEFGYLTLMNIEFALRLF